MDLAAGKAYRDRKIHADTQKENGMITVEAVLSLVPFILAILGIISFTNIFLVHNKIQYSIQQMANELSCYTYFYEALGLREADLKLKQDIDTNTEKLDSAIEQFNDFLGQINTFEDSLSELKNGEVSNLGGNLQNAGTQAQGVYEQGVGMVQTARNLASDPKAILRGFVYLAAEKAETAAKSLLLQIISGGLMEVYLDTSFSGYQPMSADEWLKYFGVKNGVDGLDFGKSELFSDENYRMIDIVVEYDLEVYFFRLFLKDPTIHVVQRCAVPAWLDGDGKHYTKG